MHELLHKATAHLRSRLAHLQPYGSGQITPIDKALPADL